jgi:uncharacterized protein YbcI
MSDPRGGNLLGELCTATVALTRRHSGKGPTKCRAAWAGPDAILILLGDGLTAAEQTVSDAGHEHDVLALRGRYHDAMNERMSELVERRTSRSVHAAMHASHADPDLTALIFVLEPQP